MSRARERAYARRRYEKWQGKQAAKLVARRKRRTVLSVVGAMAAVALVIGIIFLTTRNPGTATAASTTPTTSKSPSASAGKNPCPTPTVKPPATPKSWKTAPAATDATKKRWKVTLATSCGPIVLELDGTKAPKAVASTVFLAQNAFYNASPCHRLTTQGLFVLQCGDPTASGSGGPGYSYGPVENAPKDNVYPTGTVAMARAGNNGNSQGSQFFLVYKDTTLPTDSAGGYTVMGTIVSGLDIVKKIAEGGIAGSGGDGSPARPISILSTSVAAG